MRGVTLGFIDVEGAETFPHEADHHLHHDKGCGISLSYERVIPR